VLLLVDKIITNNVWPVWDGLEPRPENLPPPNWNENKIAAIEASCNIEYLEALFARPLLWAPYFFRAIRLYQICSLSESISKTGTTEKKWTYFISQRNATMWLLIVLIPFFLLILIAPFAEFVGNAFPVLGM